jgi:hypothetical protein
MEKPLVGAKIRISDLREHSQARYQLSYAFSLTPRSYFCINFFLIFYSNSIAYKTIKTLDCEVKHKTDGRP